ncbi:hypothetical protein SELMODRAFT_177107 [Selaginella moellendorffii]|uniref:Protein CLP1 homolog n=1 Tax=Selaginella moellendorffii TaxID=88036 RepID=D8S5Q3_SELML|nr:protein CLP1 homolog [Selaginella moellendorffii]EFJ20213.1 hypothetical protein SELMODRAFT_177107 [Selaginella moellendorffii]|eukprot:XP_002978766.1 protein CLP1 homolog [Selaginella moellendorffii]
MASDGNLAPGDAVRRFELRKESELRVEVGVDGPLRMQLVAGTAEIFGTELPPQYWLTFSPSQKFAVFTWGGALLELDGVSEVAYVADETPMVSYVNVHAVLENRRRRAREAAISLHNAPGEIPNPLTQGPRVMVVGPTDSGKSSLTKMLLGWAARQQWKPMYVDLDIGQGSITLSGAIAATPVETPVDPVEGIILDVPLVYFYGHTTPSVNTELYKILVKELAHQLDLQFASNIATRSSGMVINTMGWVDGVGYELLLHSIEALNANVILVLGQEKVYSMLHDYLRLKPGVDVVKLQKSGGVVARNQKYRQQSRFTRTKNYFYGRWNELSPHASVVNFQDIQVVRIGGGPQAPRSALPIGAEPTADPTRVVPVSINRDLVHAVLGVSYSKDPDQVLACNVAGFVYVTEVDLNRKKLTYVAPCPGPLPSNILIAGSLLWVE